MFHGRRTTFIFKSLKKELMQLLFESNTNCFRPCFIEGQFLPLFPGKKFVSMYSPPIDAEQEPLTPFEVNVESHEKFKASTKSSQAKKNGAIEIAIIGCGITGLVAALSLSKHYKALPSKPVCKIRCYDGKSKEQRDTETVLLFDHMVSLLIELGIDSLDESSTPVTKMQSMLLNEEVRTCAVELKGCISVLSHVIEDALIDCIKEEENVSLEYNHALDTFVILSSTGLITLTFTNGSVFSADF